MGVLVRSEHPVTLVGGGPVETEVLRAHVAQAPTVIAADAGAHHVLFAGLQVHHVIGDMDSVNPARLPASVRLHRIPEQMTTDLDKCLYSVEAPYFLAHGFTGGRADHQLAACHALVRAPAQKAFLVGSHDVTFLAPRELEIDLPEGTRLSLFPMGEVEGQSEGLLYPIAPHRFAPDRMIGTSNAVARGPVRLQFSARRMLVIVPINHLDRVLAATVGT